ncbi:YcxB family protein [Flammeovirga sp. MY04]|uniref:YcxB family protein n=1 Tax=Flammeovirga sp. MY04 TaxID=1191459 RepID=UPI000806082B|nr:YcxB family protein [Flammeovirga sp. MY04]ANQ47460.1 YcxB family protein [Flammeovirga sp. MY04]
MTIEYKQTKEHLIEYNKYVLSNNKKYKRNIFFIRAVIAIIIFAVFNNLVKDVPLFEPYDTYIPFVMAGVVLFITSLSDQSKLIVKNMLKANPQLIGERKVEVLENELTIEDDKGKTVYPFESFTQKVETTNLLLLFLSETVAIVIPKEVFGNVDEKEEFLNRIDDHKTYNKN